MVWSAQQYLKFEDERTRAARDLLAQVPLERVATGYDLGCGPGNSTQLLTERFGPDVITGVDSDDDMLEKARLRLPDTPFVKADLASWTPPAKTDLLFSNAAFQWLPNHLDILERLMEHLHPGGVLAMQIPDNLDEPSHLAMEDTASAGPWRDAFSGLQIRRASPPSPADYVERLSRQSARIDVWHSIYNHRMASASAIVEWVKGTGLRPYLSVAGSAHEADFLNDYEQRIDAAYPALSDGGRLFRFPRLFVVAVKA